MDNPLISVIIPMYNEEAVIVQCHQRLSQTLGAMGERYELVFVDDGSRDNTVALVDELRPQDPCTKLICLARNHGHQLAVSAGLDYALGDAIVIIDADLQDPPELIPEMTRLWRQGYDVVYGKRKSRAGETGFKRATAWAFYRLLRWMTECEIPMDTGDFRLVSRRAADAVRSMREHNRFLRGMFSWVGFRQYALEYERDPRLAGETKYTMGKMLKLAGDGIFSFSVKPLWLVLLAGLTLTGAGVVWLFVLGILGLLGKQGLGMSALAAWMTLLSGVLADALGLVGIYIGRVYEEAKSRPLYLVARTEGFARKKGE